MKYRDGAVTRLPREQLMYHQDSFILLWEIFPFYDVLMKMLVLLTDLLVTGQILRHVGPDDVLGELQAHVLRQAGVGGGGGGS